VEELISVFLDDLRAAELREDQSGKQRVMDITHAPSDSGGVSSASTAEDYLKKVSKGVTVESSDTHALHKPVVLVSSNGGDVPFDVRHVRVIYYEVTDPFWGEKLIAKVAENIVSAIKNPNDAILFPKA
jgi:hypothetical protein